jgi:hypothetical protein
MRKKVERQINWFRQQETDIVDWTGGYPYEYASPR